jgi:two-component sensor histidine kinase
LRNPLAPIRQAALVSKAAAATDAQKRWAHEVINRQVQNMALLLDDLLDISRVTRGMLELRKEPTELAAVVDAAVETARPILDARRHTLSVRLPPEPLVFSADPLRLAQVLSNLLTNAAKYTDPDGRIDLRAVVTGGELLISVTDSGIGITADALDRIFTMFSQVKSAQDRSEGGLGIGLALAKGLVELHGGQITAHSAGSVGEASSRSACRTLTAVGNAWIQPRMLLVAMHRNAAYSSPTTIVMARRASPCCCGCKATRSRLCTMVGRRWRRSTARAPTLCFWILACPSSTAMKLRARSESAQRAPRCC